MWIPGVYDKPTQRYIRRLIERVRMEELVNCRFARRTWCSLNRVDEISVEFCSTCKDKMEDRIQGLGDAVAVTIDKTPLRRLKKKGCGCSKRQDALNRAVNFGKKSKSKNQPD